MNVLRRTITKQASACEEKRIKLRRAERLEGRNRVQSDLKDEMNTDVKTDGRE